VDRFDTSRPDQVTDVAGWTTVVASMRYLGLDRFGRIVETIWIKGETWCKKSMKGTALSLTPAYEKRLEI
jgi:hypothetical protein